MDEGKWASGQWQVQEGKESEFVDRWTGWITWTSENIPGFRSARLRAEADPLRFISVSDWDDDASLKAWKASPGFRQKIESVKELCEGFVGGDYEVAAAIPAPALRS
jgi:heme-degrading monooxygenase HmoA